jgi:hypothetical protein
MNESGNATMQHRSELGAAQRAIVLQILRDDHPQRWQRAELESKVSDIEPLLITDAFAQLHAEGVVVVEGEQVQASRSARHLDTLGLIAV